MVVNVGRDAVLHIIHIDDGRVWPFMLRQNAPSATHSRLRTGQPGITLGFSLN